MSLKVAGQKLGSSIICLVIATFVCWPWSRVSVRLSSSQAHGSSHGQVFLLGETFGHKPVLPLLVAVAFFPSFMRGYYSQWEAGPCVPDHAHEVKGTAHASGWHDVEHKTKLQLGRHGQQEARDSQPLWADTWQRECLPGVQVRVQPRALKVWVCESWSCCLS